MVILPSRARSSRLRHRSRRSAITKLAANARSFGVGPEAGAARPLFRPGGACSWLGRTVFSGSINSRSDPSGRLEGSITQVLTARRLAGCALSQAFLPCVGDITRGRSASIKSRSEFRRVAMYPKCRTVRRSQHRSSLGTARVTQVSSMRHRGESNHESRAHQAIPPGGS